jgi:hypothetical protein
MQPELAAQFGSSEAAIAKPGEEAQLDGGEKHLGIPKPKSSLQDRRRIER